MPNCSDETAQHRHCPARRRTSTRERGVKLDQSEWSVGDGNSLPTRERRLKHLAGRVEPGAVGTSLPTRQRGLKQLGVRHWPGPNSVSSGPRTRRTGSSRLARSRWSRRDWHEDTKSSPRRGRTNQPRATPWERNANPSQALKGRHKLSRMTIQDEMRSVLHRRRDPFDEPPVCGRTGCRALSGLGLDALTPVSPGRCPGLICFGPFGAIACTRRALPPDEPKF